MSTAFAKSLERLKFALRSPDADKAAAGPCELALKCMSFDRMPECVSLHDAMGRAVLVSPGSEEIYDLPPQDMLANGFIQRIHVQDRVSVLKALSDCANTGCSQRVEFRLVHEADKSKTKNGDHWCEMICQPFTAAKGDAASTGISVISVTRDISRFKHSEKVAREQFENAESASIAKGRFLANISHELRTPLNAILGFSEILKTDISDMFDTAKKREYAEHIHQSAAHLLTVLNDILDMSKMDAGKYEILPEPFDLKEVIRTTVGMLQGQAMKKKVTLTRDTNHDIPEICADQRAIKQILINLISNALKFTESGGHVVVGAHRVGRRVEIFVEDNGIGISEEHLKHLGEPFYQADSKYARKYEGTGLGLSVVRGLVDLHGGTLTFRSKRHEGTAVLVNLPLVVEGSGPVPGEDSHEILQISKPVETDLTKQKHVLPNTAAGEKAIAKDHKITG